MMLPFLQTPLRYGPISPKQICMMGKDGYDGGDSYKNASTGLCREVSQEGSVSKDNGDDSSINNINKNEEKKLVFKPISAKDTTSLTNPSRDLLHDVLETKLNNIEGERRTLQSSRVQSQKTQYYTSKKRLDVSSNHTADMIGVKILVSCCLF